MPSKTLIGQVATLIETLHLSYREVVREIPFRTLLLMAKDRQHSTTRQVWEEVSEEEYFGGEKPWE